MVSLDCVTPATNRFDLNGSVSGIWKSALGGYQLVPRDFTMISCTSKGRASGWSFDRRLTGLLDLRTPLGHKLHSHWYSSSVYTRESERCSLVDVEDEPGNIPVLIGYAATSCRMVDGQLLDYERSGPPAPSHYDAVVNLGVRTASSESNSLVRCPCSSALSYLEDP